MLRSGCNAPAYQQFRRMCAVIEVHSSNGSGNQFWFGRMITKEWSDAK